MRHNLYVGGFTAECTYLTGSPSVGIEHLTFDSDTGALESHGAIGGVRSPQYIARHPELPVLYAAEFATTAGLAAFAMGPHGSLQPLSQTGSLGELAAAVSVHPGGGYVYVANWGSGTLAQFPLDDDGRVGAAEPIPQRVVNGASRPHHIRATPNGNAVLVTFHGSDELSTYIADEDGRLASFALRTIEFPARSATRHVEFHPSGRWLYVVGEHDSMLYVLEADDGVPIRIADACPTLPAGYVEKNRTSELKLHPDAHTLYVANRGADTVAMFAVGESGADLALVGSQSTMGQGPRGITVHPDGRYLLAGNGISDDVTLLEIDADGRLEPTGTMVPSNSPSCILFVDA